MFARGGYAARVSATSPPSAAPIAAWLAAAAIAALAWGCAWLAVTQFGAQQETPFTRFNRDRIAAFSAGESGAGTRRVLLLGSSALKYATRDDAEFSARVSEASGVPVNALRITSNWGTFFDFAPLSRDIRLARPDLIVFEAEFLAADRPQWRRFLLWMRHWRALLGFEVEIDSEVISEPEVQYSLPCWRRKASRGHELLMQERAKWVAVRPHGPGPRAARALLEELLESGTRVALVSVPRRPDYDQEARETRVAALQGPQGQALSGRVQVLTAESFSQDLYCDLIHLTPDGRARFSDWLEGEVARVLASAPA